MTAVAFGIDGLDARRGRRRLPGSARRDDDGVRAGAIRTEHEMASGRGPGPLDERGGAGVAKQGIERAVARIQAQRARGGAVG